MLIKRLSVCAIHWKNSPKRSILSNYVLNPFWTWFRYPLARVGRAKHGTLPRSLPADPLFYDAIYKLTDHAELASPLCYFNFCDPIILRSDISGGKGGRNRAPPTLGVLHGGALYIHFRGPGIYGADRYHVNSFKLGRRIVPFIKPLTQIDGVVSIPGAVFGWHRG